MTVAQKRKINAKLFKPLPRQASHQHVLRVDRYIEMFADVGLELFQNVHRLKEMNLFNGCLSGEFPEPMPAIPSDLVVECLTVCTDQEQTQVTGGEFIFTPEPFGLGCTGARLHDDFHRWNNDLSMAVALAGLKPSEKAGTLIANIGYGPWQTAAWFNALCAQGSKASERLRPNDRLVLRHWKTHLLYSDKLDEGDGDGDSTGTDGRRRWLKQLPQEEHMQVKGIKVSPSTWMSFQGAWHAWLPAVGSRALVMSSLCFDKGWILTEEDLFSPTRCGAETSGEKPAIKSKAEGVRRAKAKVDALMNRSRNTLVVATKLICDVDVVRGIAILLHGSKGEWTSFNGLVQTLTSSAETLRHCQSWAHSGWLAGLKVTLSCLTDLTGLHKCGIDTDFKEFEICGVKPEDASVRYQDALSQTLGGFVDVLVGLRAGSLAERTFHYPFKLAALTSDDNGVVAAALQEFRMDVEAYWASKDREPTPEGPDPPLP